MGQIVDESGPLILNVFGNVHAFAVTFEGDSSKTVATNEASVYEANLPLGLWTLTVRPYGPDAKIIANMTLYRRPPFRVTKPTNVVFDISLPRAVVRRYEADWPEWRPSNSRAAGRPESMVCWRRVFSRSDC
jgi:hypothetical protein